MIDHKDRHIPSPLIMFTCTTLCHALLVWQMNKGVHLKASKSKRKVDKPDSLNYFNYKNNSGKISFFCAVMSSKLLTSPGIADSYTFLMNPWNTLPESYQQRVYENTLATVNRQIQQVEKPMPSMVISMEAAGNDKDILLDYLSSDVALEKPGIGRADPNIPIDNNCTDDKFHFRIPGGSGDYQDECDESKERDVIATASWQ